MKSDFNQWQKLFEFSQHCAGTAAALPARRCPLYRRPFVGVMRIVSQTGEKVASHVHSFRGTIFADIVSESDEPCFPLTSLPHPRPARSPTIRLPQSIPKNPFRLTGPAQVKVAVLHYTARGYFMGRGNPRPRAGGGRRCCGSMRCKLGEWLRLRM
jgi:hypothetical protein